MTVEWCLALLTPLFNPKEMFSFNSVRSLKNQIVDRIFRRSTVQESGLQESRITCTIGQNRYGSYKARTHISTELKHIILAVNQRISGYYLLNCIVFLHVINVCMEMCIVSYKEGDLHSNL